MLGLQAVQKSNGVCVHTKPPSAAFSSRSVTNHAQIITAKVTFSNNFAPA
jgi:hypothetical protein